MDPTELSQHIVAWLTSAVTASFGAIVLVASIVALWRVFAKAGQPGWAALVPLYNMYLSFKIAGLNPWLFLLMFVPLVNLVMAVVWGIRFGAAFGKGGLWSFFLLVLFSTIGLLILGFGSAGYRRQRFA
ncbi:DUF5684 domain-containing protein [Micropruina sp.]|uniref:DUF5684 domain-containing protein n=1 Tax=Micropruina sp. TaxID=2737536 RepID=UPI0039E6D0A1